MIEFKDIHKIYSLGEVKIHALAGVSLSIRAGEFIAIMGPSGSGKSTLMNIIGCLTTPTSGIYLLEGVNLSQVPYSTLPSIRNKKVGFIFQQFHLLPRLSAIRNVELPLIYAEYKSKERYQLAYESLASLGLKYRVSHLPNQLSGGEQQRVAIARALVNHPTIILADEPTGNLDSTTGKEIMEIFKQLNQQGKTIILVTHEDGWAVYASRIIMLKDGKVVDDG
ncbi:MAG: ABC transporter ATP-binding protein [bacterium]